MQLASFVLDGRGHPMVRPGGPDPFDAAVPAPV